MTTPMATAATAPARTAPDGFEGRDGTGSAKLAPVRNRVTDGQFDLPVDRWYQLAPRGEFGHPESGVTQVIDERAICEMVRRFPADLQSGAVAGLLVDYDHFSYQSDKSSEAAGWVVALEGRADGLWGQIRWTPEGEAAVRHGRYRFLSPVWLRADCETIFAPADGGPGTRRLRPLRLDSAGLTNNPNLRGMAPVSNREPRATKTEFGVGNPEQFGSGRRNERKPMNEQLLRELGLGNDATAEAAVAALQALKNRAARLEQTNRELLETQVEADLARYEDRFKAEGRERWRAALLANRAATLELLAGLKLAGTEGGAGGVGGGVVHAPGQGRVPPPSATGVDRAARQRAEVLAYQNRHGCGFDQAWRAVRSEQPALFVHGQPA